MAAAASDSAVTCPLTPAEPPRVVRRLALAHRLRLVRFGLTATVRPSLALYNTYQEVDALVRAVDEADFRYFERTRSVAAVLTLPSV